MADAKPKAAQLIATRYDDPEQCAKIAKLRYASPEMPRMDRRALG